MARAEDGAGFCEVHVNTPEGFWLLLRSWLRPHREILQETLPLYMGFFEFVHNARRRGKALLGALIGLLLKPVLRSCGSGRCRLRRALRARGLQELPDAGSARALTTG